MLIQEPKIFTPDFILSLMAELEGKPLAKELRPGVYEIGHFGASHFLPDYEHYPETSLDTASGVCDSVDQLLAACPELDSSDRQFVITVHSIKKSEQPDEDGWRWHKWGPYIGTQEPQCEYIRNEPDIEEVLVFHIYEKKMNDIEDILKTSDDDILAEVRENGLDPKSEADKIRCLFEETEKEVQLTKAIEHAINSHSAENGSNTPDFILAHYLTDCLRAFDQAVRARETWHGRQGDCHPTHEPRQMLLDPKMLPAPRLELRWHKIGDSWEERECVYSLALPLREHDIRREDKDGNKVRNEVLVELNRTKVNGGWRYLFIERDENGNPYIDTPFRDGAHANWDSVVLGLPVFVIFEDKALPFTVTEEPQ